MGYGSIFGIAFGACGQLGWHPVAEIKDDWNTEQGNWFC